MLLSDEEYLGVFAKYIYDVPTATHIGASVALNFSICPGHLALVHLLFSQDKYRSGDRLYLYVLSQ